MGTCYCFLCAFVFKKSILWQNLCGFSRQNNRNKTLDGFLMHIGFTVFFLNE